MHYIEDHFSCTVRRIIKTLIFLLTPASASAQFDVLDEVGPRTGKQVDWLLDPTEFKAGVYRTEIAGEIALDNGLLRRTFRTSPNGATVGFDNLVTGESLLRGVNPEATVTIDGRRLDVGGLTGQPNYAYLLPEWLEEMESDENAMQFVGFHVGKPQERFAWKRVRHHARDVNWPPKGAYLRMDYGMPTRSSPLLLSETREQLWKDGFQTLDARWNITHSERHPRTSFENEGKAGEIFTLASHHCFAERELPKNTEALEALIDPGTDQGVSWGPGVALVVKDRVVRVSLRSGDRGDHGHFELRDNGSERLASVTQFAASDGGLDPSKAYRIRAVMRSRKLLWYVSEGASERASFQPLFEVDLQKNERPIGLRVGKMDRSGGASDDPRYPRELGHCRILEEGVYGPKKADVEAIGHAKENITVSVHYEMYDGVPALSKWITVQNNTSHEITVDSFTSEWLAVVEHSSLVEARDSIPLPRPEQLHVETDFAFGGMTHRNANRNVVHWRLDPQYATQVNYLKKTPCLLAVEPTYGPAQTIAPGKTFVSFRAFELAYDSSERERRGLSLRRMYRTIAPWITENPLMHHLLNSNPVQVKAAIDQAAEIGFEMIILSFGSGFNMDNDSDSYLQTWKAVADYAHSKGIEIGSYSLLSSRLAPAGNMIVSPEGQRPTHGQCPALTSQWGKAYFARLENFYRTTGFDLLEHDGSYPGDVDVTARPPLQKGEKDSRWAQWRIITDYYKWCGSLGVYVNVPDYYFLSGANKTGMGYREVNWSLPRAQQVIHTRQNIFDGTWQKTPSMGWMFVPLAQYHGGGEAATVEPLDEHLDHYSRMIDCNLALGVQACYRGPRLFDTERTKLAVKQRVIWFKKYRNVLESDLIHGRRADGKSLDWMLHVNPTGEHKEMLVVFNPRKQELTRELSISLYYTGLTDEARVTDGTGKQQVLKVERDYSVKLQVEVPAEGMSWYLVE